MGTKWVQNSRQFRQHGARPSSRKPGFFVGECHQRFVQTAAVRNLGLSTAGVEQPSCNAAERPSEGATD
jgi:hypothetical protein